MSSLLSEKDRRGYMLGLRIASDFGAVIALPVVFFVWGGRKLDAAYSMSPWYTIGAFILSAFLSGYMINRKAKRYAKEFADLDLPNQSK